MGLLNWENQAILKIEPAPVHFCLQLSEIPKFQDLQECVLEFDGFLWFMPVLQEFGE